VYVPIDLLRAKYRFLDLSDDNFLEFDVRAVLHEETGAF
jgi:hypothetical protein